MAGWSAAFFVAIVAFLGALAAGMAPRYLPAVKADHWPATTATAAGLLLSSAMVIVIPEGFEVLFLSHNDKALHSDSFLGMPPVLASGVAILGGFLFILWLEGRGIGHDIDDTQQTAQILSLGLALHALTDGLALGASIATGLMAITVPVLAAVMVHKIPVAFGLGAFLWRDAKMDSTPLRNLLMFCAATPLGLLTTFLFLRQLSHEWIGLLLLFSGGTFLYVATVDVLSRIRNDQPPSVLFKRILAGVVLVIGGLILFQLLGFEAEFHV